jgi:broad specificity phosphatase PhoE
VILSSMLGTDALAQPTVIVVRHGQKIDNTPDAGLSPQGEARAIRLATMLAAANVRAIYTTQYKRTMLMAAPTAKQSGITSVSIPASDTAALLARIGKHAKEEVVLVVGHSNTLPEILKGLGHTTAVTVAEEDFDDLFVVAMQPSGVPSVVRLKY